jgi:multidrug transporter EmrE-like cation transporter
MPKIFLNIDKMDWGFIHVILLSIVEIFGDFNLRFYAQSHKIQYLGYGLAGYAGVIFFLYKSFLYNNVLFVNALWDGMSNVIESIAAFVILGDRLESAEQYVGLFLLLAGIVLLKLPPKRI